MPAYAMVVVVEAPDPGEAQRRQGAPGKQASVLFVGEPWKVGPLSVDPDEFDTMYCIEQHPERTRRREWEC